MQVYRQTIDELEKHLQAINQPTPFNPQLIVEVLKSQHETFLSLASQIASIHDKVAELKEIYLTYRAKYFNDNVNPFDRKKASEKAKSQGLLIQNSQQLQSQPQPQQQPQPQPQLFQSQPQQQFQSFAPSTQSFGSSFTQPQQQQTQPQNTSKFFFSSPYLKKKFF